MKILTFHDINIRYSYTNYCISLIIYLNRASEVWLFNCSESTQHNLLKHQIKLSLISKIFITRLTLNNISGLSGLLSTLNLDDRHRTLDIYGPKELQIYLKFNNKYSQTNYSYPIRIHNSKLHNIFFTTLYNIRVISFKHKKLGYIITFRQSLGKFNLPYAIIFNIIRGPLYGKLKQHNNFITPDGHEIHGRLFSSIQQKGQKIIVVPSFKNKAILKELSWETDYIFYTN